MKQSIVISHLSDRDMPSPSFDPGDGCFPTGSGGEQVLQGTVAASHGMELEVLREHPMKSKGDVVRMRVSCKFEIVSRLYMCVCVFVCTGFNLNSLHMFQMFQCIRTP